MECKLCYSCSQLGGGCFCLVLQSVVGKVKTSFGGFPPKEGCSLLDPSIMSWTTMMALSSHGKVFSGLRFL